ncbi:MAG: carboxypeptidase regulatory-like domain-containing protein, partial [Chloroflexia bacterium]|nr:carboxypeptidase regulatory-like domain-containing protein [Chloroflexia bacterium]
NHDVPLGGCGKPACAGSNDWPNYEYGWGYLDALAAVQMAGVGDMGYLHGTITEGSKAPGDPLPDITVTAMRDGGGEWEATTDATGYYTMGLMVGTYTVTAEGEAYAPQTVTNVDVNSTTATLLDFSLQPKGLVWGYVTDFDSGAPLEGALVEADNGAMATADATGYYTMYLEAGTYVMTATMADYADDVETVVVPVGGSVQQDFALLAAIAVVPEPIEISLEMYTTGNLAAQMTNNMAEDYDFEFMEAAVSSLMAGEDVLVVDDDAASATTIETSLTNLGYTWMEVDVATFAGMAIPDLLDYQAVFVAGGWTVPSYDTAFMAYLDAGGALFIADNDLGYQYSTGGVFYNDYLQSTYASDSGSDGVVTGVDIMSGLSFDISADPYPDDFIVGAEGTEIFTAISGNSAGVKVDRLGYRAIYLAWEFEYTGADSDEVIQRSMDFLGGGDVPWYGTSIAGGTVPAGGSLGWTNYFTATPAAGVTEPGTYEALLKIKPDDPTHPDKEVQVLLHVTPPADLGKLEGTITSDRPGGPIEGAVLWADDGTTVYSYTTEADGYYYLWLLQGSYDITATAAGYIPEARTTTIVGQVTTTEDFQLILDAPEIVVAPTFMEEFLDMGQTSTQILTIYNDGVQPLDFEIGEVDNGYTPLAQCEEYYGGDLGSVWGPGGTRDRGDFFEATENTVLSEIFVYLNFSAPSDMYFIVYEADALVGTYTKIFEHQVSGLPAGAQWHGSGPVSVPIEAGKFYYVGGSWNGSANYYRNSVDPTPFATNCFGILHTGNPGTLAGYPPAATGNNTYGSGYIADYGVGVITGGGDVPWLSEAPITGTVPAGSSIDVDVDFDAGVVPEPGVYMADLRISNNDPLNDEVTVPVTLTVSPSADYGKLEGYVYSDRPYEPLEKAVVWIDDGTTVVSSTTDASGYYYHWLLVGTYNLTATMPGYWPGYDSVEVLSQDVVTRSFVLTLDAPEIAVNPMSMEETLTFGDTASQTLTIDNLGIATLTYELAEQDRGFQPPVLSIPPFEGELPQDDRPVSTERAPDLPELDGESAPLTPWPLAGEPAFALDVYPGYNLVYIPDTTVPGTWNVVGAVTQFHPAGDFVGGDFSTLYAFDYDTNEFVAIDTATAVRTVIGTTTGNGNWTGLTGAADGTLYASSSVCGTSSTLYTIDPATGAATQIGNITNGTCIIDIAINAQGEMYGVDIVTDQLIQIDPATGAGTVVGSLGVSANYAQGMDFEEVSGVLYWAAYTTQGELRVIDTASGASTLVGAFPGGAEVDAFAFATGGGGGDVPWLSEVPVSGMVAPYDSTDVEIHFDAGAVPEPGTYLANLHVNSDDPFNGKVTLPITMNVLPAGDIALLNGNIYGTGYCDGEIYPIEGADVTVEGPGGPYTMTTDATGYYYRWLYEGFYTVTASAAEHDSNWGTIQVYTDTTNTLDLNLRYIESCMNVEPLSYAVNVPIDQVYTQTLNIFNEGAGELAWEIRETTTTMGLMAIGDELFQADVGAVTGDTQILGVEWALGYWWVTGGNSGVDPNKLYKIDTSGTLVATYDQPASATDWGWRDMAWDGTYLYGSASTAIDCFDPVNETMQANCLTGPQNPNRALAYDPATDHFWTANWGSNIYEFDRSGTIVNQYPNTLSAYGMIWDMYSDGGPFLWVWSQDGTPAAQATQIDPTTGNPTGVTFQGIDPGWVDNMAGGATAINGDYPGFEGMLIFAGMHQADSDTVVGYDLDAMAASPWGNIPWVSEVPTTGVNLPDTPFPVDVIFDTHGLSIGVCYTGSLALFHDDPGWDDPVMIPLELCVTAPCDPVEILDVAADIDLCTVTFSADVTGTEPIDYLWDFGDGMTSTMAMPTHEYAASGDYTATLHVWNCDGFGHDVVEIPVSVVCELPVDVTMIYHDLEDVVAMGEAVYVAGSFNGWDPLAHPLAANADASVFSLTVSLDVGTYEYKYVVYTDTMAGGPAHWDWLNTGNHMVDVTEAMAVDDYRAVDVGYAHLVEPAAITLTLGEATGPITGEVYIQNVTDPAGEGRAVMAELGYGTDPDPANWTWMPLTFAGVQNGNNDLYWAEFTPAAVGVYSYAVRFDGNWATMNPNAGWTYGDLDGVYPGEPFELGNAGVLTVLEPPCVAVELLDYGYTADLCSVDFTADVTGTEPFSWLWHFGDDVTDTAAMPTHVYAESGTYTVTLEVWNCEGAGYDTATFPVTVDCEIIYKIYLPLLLNAYEF